MANTVDIAPELLEAITKEIQEAVEKDPVLQQVLQRIEDGTATYEDAYKYAERYGEIEADALSKYLTEENLPNGRLYQNIAERTVKPTMQDTERRVNQISADVQTALNKNAGLNIKGVEASIDQEHIDGIVKKLSYSESIDRVAYLLRDPMVTTLMHAVDRTIQKNVELHADVGLNPIVKRISVGGCCEWCQERAGTYDYIEDDLWTHGSEVYRRHNFCRCLILYNPRDGKGWQNVHHQQDWGSQRELSSKEAARRRARIDVSKQVASEDIAKQTQREKRYRELIKDAYGQIDKDLRISYEQIKINNSNKKSIQLVNGKTLNLTSKQFGKKLGKHAEDYGLDPRDENDRRSFLAFTMEVIESPNEIRRGFWRGQKEDCFFYIKGNDVVIVREDGEYVSTLKDGVNNPRVIEAKKYER